MKNRYPFIEIKQNNEVFYSTKMKLSFLKSSVDFHFRNPYDNSSQDSLLAEKYISDLETMMGIEYKSSEEGIQRRTDIKRIREISNYVKSADGIIFPTPIVLAFNLFEGEGFEGNSFYSISSENNVIEFSEDVRFSIIDGQHRLAGAVLAYNQMVCIYKDFDIELAVTLIPNAGLSKATQMFIDINGNQRKVNKSMIYDLYSNVRNEQIDNINKYITVTQTLNDRSTSPLYQKIKRLGVGSGNISQAFFVDYLQAAYDSVTPHKSPQAIYAEVFQYFDVISDIYSNSWSNGSSNLLKTNGFGALLLLLPKLLSQYEQDRNYKSIDYYFFEYFNQRSNFNWDDPNFTTGTGKKMQKIISSKLDNYFDGI